MNKKRKLDDDTPTCQLEGCSKPVFIERSGKVHDYCCKTHGKKAKKKVEVEYHQ